MMRSFSNLVKKLLKTGLIINTIASILLVIYFCFFDSIFSKRDLLLCSIIFGLSIGFLMYKKKTCIKKLKKIFKMSTECLQQWMFMVGN